MSTHVVVNSLSAHVTITKGDLSAQFYVNRDGLSPPIYLYSGGIGYMLRNKDAAIEFIPAELREDVEKAIRKYQAKFLLKGDT
jgi:uncharacterized circularly permuted ATP-grasp superfamily protein